MTPTTFVLVALLPIWTAAQPAPRNTSIFGGYPTDNSALDYYRASHSSNTTNAVNFPGYNWSGSLSSTFSINDTSSPDTWQIHLNYSRVTVPTNEGNATTGLTVLSMTFSDEQWPSDSDWQLCASFPLGAVPDSIASKAGNNSDASCAPYLGQSCLNALMEAYGAQSTPRIGPGCPNLPPLSGIDECKSVADAFSGGIGTSAITNTTSPDLVYESTQYVNVSGSGPTYLRSNVTYQGLSSGQAFASFLSVFPNTNVDAESVVESKRLRIIGLSIVPALDYRLNSTGAYGWAANTRLICARANTSSSSSSAASRFGKVPVVVLLVAMAVASFVAL